MYGHSQSSKLGSNALPTFNTRADTISSVVSAGEKLRLSNFLILCMLRQLCATYTDLVLKMEKMAIHLINYSVYTDLFENIRSTGLENNDSPHFQHV